MVCPICKKRPAKRFCPALGEKICAICCGEGREVTIDCRSDCPYLVAGHKYEAEHRKPITREEFPHRDLQVPPDFVYERWPLVTAIAGAILNFQMQNKDLRDSAVLAAVGALAETYRTLETGIYYERPPDAPIARALYTQLGHFIQELRSKETQRIGTSAVKDADVFRLLVFLSRVGKQETNGRPLTRGFLAFLRARFPMPSAPEKEAPRIIMP
jgi:hypothetical protein